MNRCWLILALFIAPAIAAQNRKLFLRSDTLVWHTGQSPDLAQILLKQAMQGMIKLADALTGEEVPVSKIYNWKMPVDTIAAQDNDGRVSYNVVEQTRQPGSITQVRICHDWFADTVTGELSSQVRRIDLIESIVSTNGTFRGYKPLFTINYFP